MKKNWQHITHSGQCPPIDKLELYYKGKLSKEENFVIENHLASCEICNDLLEGLATLKNIESLGNIENELKRHLHEKLFKEKPKQKILPVYQRIAIAASILLIIGISVFYYFNNEKPIKQVAQNIPEKSSHFSGKSELKKEAKEQYIPNLKSAEKKEYKARAIEKNKTVDAVPMSEIQFEAGKGSNENYKSSQITAADTVFANSPLAIASDKSVSEINSDYTIKERSEKREEKDAKIEYRSLISGNNVINGRVTDEKGKPLPGVNIVIKGTEKGVVSKIDGRFTIALNKPDDILNISYVGYKNQELTAFKEADVKITLEPEVTALNEVVVVGYGVQKKMAVTASVAAVSKNNMSAKETEKRKILISEIDSLNIVLSIDKQNTKALKEIIEKYLELNNKNEALVKLNEFNKLAKDEIEKKEIDDIIQLTKDEKYSKAKKRLRKLN